MRGGREFTNYLDQNDPNDEKQSRFTDTPFPIEEILSSLQKDIDGENLENELKAPTSTNFKFVESNSKLSGFKRNRSSPRSSSSTNSGRAGRLGSPRHDREHVSFLAGIRILQNGRNTDKYSGYQVMRLATELVPAYAAILGKQGKRQNLHLTLPDNIIRFLKGKPPYPLYKIPTIAS